MQKIKRFKQILLSVCMVAVLSFTFSQSVFAMTESEIQAQVNAVGKETASGSVLIWFLCAIAFLKVSTPLCRALGSTWGIRAVPCWQRPWLPPGA